MKLESMSLSKLSRMDLAWWRDGFISIVMLVVVYSDCLADRPNDIEDLARRHGMVRAA